MPAFRLSFRLRLSLAAPLLLLLLVVGGTSPAAERTLSAADVQSGAIISAAPGSVLKLLPGDYGALEMDGLSGLRIQAADPADPPRFSGLVLKSVSGIALQNLIFAYEFTPGDKLSARIFRITGSKGVSMDRILFRGDRARGRSVADDGYPTGSGLSVHLSSDVVVENSEFRSFHRGLLVGRSRNITIRGNELHDIRMDGMNFAQVEDVRIEDNYIHDFARSLESADHSDMIQFWTSKTEAPSRNVVIRNNVLDAGGGYATQSIFMRNEEVDRGRAGEEMFYRNFLVEQNVILNAHLAGITIGAVDGVTIRNNTLLRRASAVPPSTRGDKNQRVTYPRISVNEVSRRVEVRDNITGRIPDAKGRTGWTITGNLLVQDEGPSKAGYYDKFFRNPLDPATKGFADFAYRPEAGISDSVGSDRLRHAQPSWP